MKYNLLLPLLCIYCFATAQSTCDYKINVDTQEEIFQLTQESLIDFTVREKKTIFVYFSLMKQDSVKSVVLSISLNSQEIPPLICYNKKSRISFKLEDSTYVSAPYLGVDVCARQSKGENTMNNSTSEASFYLDSLAVERLSKSPIESLRIGSLNTNFDLKLIEVISNEQLANPIYPKEFFINTGVYVLEPKALEFIPQDEFFDLPSLFDILKNESENTKSFEITDYWIDMCNPFDYESINKKIRSGL